MPRKLSPDQEHIIYRVCDLVKPESQAKLGKALEDPDSFGETDSVFGMNLLLALEQNDFFGEDALDFKEQIAQIFGVDFEVYTEYVKSIVTNVLLDRAQARFRQTRQNYGNQTDYQDLRNASFE